MDKKKTPALGRNVAKVMLVSATLGRPMITTPGIPADRIKLLRDAYLKTFKEAEVVEEAKKINSISKPFPAPKSRRKFVT